MQSCRQVDVMVMGSVIIQLVDCVLNFPSQLVGFVEKSKEFVFDMLGAVISFVNFGEDFLQFFIDVGCFG